ncbi:unnamed protein product [Acanthoscelides obtectus]|uniref:Uncharacterized protein n=1 Tax=Acanthoscelides obtectus TaxID=200917 RepID=A0A9P0VUM7_ACAOB|nr:unnamed protein product [Acanthoscelides obtectus]CAK1685551.1 hypothetical protein AOBTE_LOCUS35502 [Acanthoscelides obtectus]
MWKLLATFCKSAILFMKSECDATMKWPTRSPPMPDRNGRPRRNHMCVTDGQLYKPDIVVHLEGARTGFCDIQVSWEGNNGLGQPWQRKRLVYGNDKFVEAAVFDGRAVRLNFAPYHRGPRHMAALQRAH